MILTAFELIEQMTSFSRVVKVKDLSLNGKTKLEDYRVQVWALHLVTLEQSLGRGLCFLIASNLDISSFFSILGDFCPQTQVSFSNFAQCNPCPANVLSFFLDVVRGTGKDQSDATTYFSPVSLANCSRNENIPAQRIDLSLVLIFASWAT